MAPRERGHLFERLSLVGLPSNADGSHHGRLFERELAFDMADHDGRRHHHHGGGHTGKNEPEKTKTVAVSRHRAPLMSHCHWSRRQAHRFTRKITKCADNARRNREFPSVRDY